MTNYRFYFKHIDSNGRKIFRIESRLKFHGY